MSTLHFFPKQPSEEFGITMDFATYRLQSPEQINTQVVTVEKISDGSDVTADILVSSAHDGAIVSARVKDGDAGERYNIKMAVTSDAAPANKYEADVIMEVLEKP